MNAEAPPPAAPPIQATVAGNRLAVIETGEERLAAILELIEGAQESLRLLFYMFASDDSGRAVRDALVAAARRGVHVRLLLDGFGCANADPKFFEPLADEGGSFCLFHPRYGRRYLVRNHQKLAIADETRALIGGSNVHDSYMHDQGPKHWRDLWLSVEGSAVPAAADYFDSVYRWTTSKKGKLRQLRRLMHRHSQFRGLVQWKFTGPISVRNSWRTGLARQVRKGKRLDIIAAYFSPPGSMLRRIARVARKGQARVITASKSDNHATISAARYSYSYLLARGVEMYEYAPARLHTKLVIVDDVVSIGSANLDFRSLYLNLEIMLVIRDKGFADQMRGYFERERAESVRITPALHRRRGRSLIRRIRWMLSHFLVTSMDYTVTRRLNLGREA